MNKKVLTLCAAMLLCGSLATVNAASQTTDWLKNQPKVEVVGSVYTIGQDLDLGNDYLLIDQDGVTIKGANGATLKGRIVIEAEGVTIKNLNIELKNEASEFSYYKNAITVVASSATITGNTIKSVASSKGYMANGISIFPTVDGAKFKVDGNTFVGFNKVATDSSTSAALLVSEGLTDFDVDGDGGSKTVTTENQTNFNVAALGNNKFEDCGVDYAYASFAAETYKQTNKQIRVTPVYGLDGALLNENAIKELVTESDAQTVAVFNGNAADLMDVVKLSGDQINTVIECNDVYVLFGNATAPDNDKPANAVVGGAASAPEALGNFKLVKDEDKLKGYYLLGMKDSDGNVRVVSEQNKLVKFEDAFANKAEYLWKMTETKKDGNYIYTFTNYATGKLLVSGANAGTGQDGTFEPVNNQPYNKGLLLAVNGNDMEVASPAYYGLYQTSDKAANLANLQELVNTADYFNIVSKDADTEGKVLSIVENSGLKAGWVDAETVLLNAPEAQWYIGQVQLDGEVVFMNRENKTVMTTEALVYNVTEGVYEINGHKVALNAVENVTEFDGFKNYSDAEMANATYTIASYSAVRGDAYFAENHKDSHKIGLTSDVDAATSWSLHKFNAPTDTIKITNTIVKWNTDAYAFENVTETLKVLSYAIQNEANGEYIVYNGNDQDNNNTKFYTCDDEANKLNDAVKFALKAQPNGTYNLVEVSGTALSGNKMYAGDSEKNGMLNRISTIYNQTENDLFTLSTGVKRDYRRVANLDTVAFYREANNYDYLFEQAENGINFLGVKSNKEGEFAPAMVAVETYSDAARDYYKPEYMLVVNPTIEAADTAWCDASTHKHETLEDSLACPHTIITPAHISGRFLVNYADSAKAWADAHNKDIHSIDNPYLNNGQSYRLGFVEGTYTYDKDAKKPFLAIEKAGATANDTLAVSNEGWTPAEFSFKYVDEAAGTFNIQTAYNKDNQNVVEFVKLINGVAVLTDGQNNPEVFNLVENYEGNPTANESIEANGEVSVVATDGAVVVKGAEGKNVVVSTILGKVVANEVLTSDNATIAVPAGIVVVSVDGEAFKVAVK